MKRCMFISWLLAALVLWGCAPQAEIAQASAPVQTTVATTVQTEPPSGWQETAGLRYYLLEGGTRATGWLEYEGNTYYFSDMGYLHTGWLEHEGSTYYFKEDGTMATGALAIDGSTYHFASTGKRISLVNAWNPVPETYTPDLVTLSTLYANEGIKVDSSCYADLIEMLQACNAECPRVCVVSGYRTYNRQKTNYNRRVNRLRNQGYDRETAEAKAAQIIARPGTSEHQLGLAVDIIDTRLWKLNEAQAQLPAQKWLMENCWRYGFILRYPQGKTDITGIIYEPWHYRYVGKEVAQELHSSGLTLEEYIQNLTQ